MRIHHLSCGTNVPWGGSLYGPVEDPLLRRLVYNCLLIETPHAGLVLVDTAFGLGDIYRARQRLSRFFMFTNRIQLDDEQTALRQVEKLGYGALDVRHIVLTHLDFDHAGGMEDFPHATVHVLDTEWTAANTARRGFIARNRYRPQEWALDVAWKRHQAGGPRWMGFDCVGDMLGLPPEILMMPLPGHTWGHCGVAVNPGRSAFEGKAASANDPGMSPFDPERTSAVRAGRQQLIAARRRPWGLRAQRRCA